MLRGYGGLCLTRPDAGEGALTMQACDGQETQLWRFEPGETATAFMIRAETDPLCIAVNGRAESDLVVGPCSGHTTFLPNLAKQSGSDFAAQSTTTLPEGALQSFPIREFMLAAGGEIQPAGLTDQCFDVPDVRTSDYVAGKGGPKIGRSVQIFNCLDSQLNQKWNLTAQLVSEDKCLSLVGFTTINGASVRVVSCTNSNAQRWDYYW
jgi:hypothetical protein